jgi:hypothetical protein
MNPWLSFALGLFVGTAFTVYCVSWLVAAAVQSTATDQPDEVVERIEAQKEQAKWN